MHDRERFHHPLVVVFLFSFLTLFLLLLNLFAPPLQADNRIYARSVAPPDHSSVIVESITMTLTPVDDTYVWDFYPDQSFGEGSSFWMGTGSNALLKFVISDTLPEGADVTSAVLSLELHPYSHMGGERGLAQVLSGDDWDETSVTWNNQPAVDAYAPVASTVLSEYEEGAEDTWDVTDLVRYKLSNISDTSPISISIRLSPENQTYLSQEWYSKESGRPPKLTITYKITSSVPTPTVTATRTPTPTSTPTITYTSTPSQGGSILGDYVWEDANANGIQEVGEHGIAGITVELFDVGDCSGPAMRVATTDENGSYAFRDLISGTYSVKFVLPVHYAFSPQNQGEDDSVDSDADVVTGCTGEIELGEEVSDLTWDAGMRRLPGTTVTPTTTPGPHAYRLWLPLALVSPET